MKFFPSKNWEPVYASNGQRITIVRSWISNQKKIIKKCIWNVFLMSNSLHYSFVMFFWSKNYGFITFFSTLASIFLLLFLFYHGFLKLRTFSSEFYLIVFKDGAIFQNVFNFPMIFFLQFMFFMMQTNFSSFYTFNFFTRLTFTRLTVLCLTL